MRVRIGFQTDLLRLLVFFARLRLVESGEISLGDIIKEPGVALNVMATNFQSNMVAMAMQSAVTAFGFRFGRRLLRRPLSSVQRNIVKPLLGAGVALNVMATWSEDSELE